MQTTIDPNPRSSSSSSSSSSEEILDCLKCPICHEQLFQPCSLQCGHNFCQLCLCGHLISARASASQCPICRAEICPRSIDQLGINHQLASLIERVTPNAFSSMALHHDFLAALRDVICDAVKSGTRHLFTSLEVCEFLLLWLRGQSTKEEDSIPQARHYDQLSTELRQLFQRVGLTKEADALSLQKVLRQIISSQRWFFDPQVHCLLEYRLALAPAKSLNNGWDQTSPPLWSATTDDRGQQPQTPLESEVDEEERIDNDLESSLSSSSLSSSVDQDEEHNYDGFLILRETSGEAFNETAFDQAMAEYCELRDRHDGFAESTVRSTNEIYLDFFFHLMRRFNPILFRTLKKGWTNDDDSQAFPSFRLLSLGDKEASTWDHDAHA